ncbi:uncharacterized protein LOC134658618 [Cydia amplana]|uniref:uncharacterized protein LOC134658618 n=1 Tax=Cydia amplana TaxID=1869771 RepID=UPI002FE5E379
MFKAACLLLFIGLAASESSISSVISRLLDQAKRSKSRSPLILVVNSQALQESSSSVEVPVEPTFRQSGESNGISLMTVLTQILIVYLLNQVSPKSRSPLILVVNSQALQESSSSVEVPVEPTFRQSGESNGISLMTVLTQLSKARQNPTVYRSRPRYQLARKPQKRNPVYKSLLSLRNSLRCGARDECKDECSEISKRKEQKKCDKKCEKKYECDEEEEPRCDEDDCGDSSTKGPPPDDNEPKCTRC